MSDKMIIGHGPIPAIMCDKYNSFFLNVIIRDFKCAYFRYRFMILRESKKVLRLCTYV